MQIAGAVAHQLVEEIRSIAVGELARGRSKSAVVTARHQVPDVAFALRPDHPDAAAGILGNGGVENILTGRGQRFGGRPAVRCGMGGQHAVAAVFVNLPGGPGGAVGGDGERRMIVLLSFFDRRNPDGRGHGLDGHVAVFKRENLRAFQVVEAEGIDAPAGADGDARGGGRIEHRGDALRNHVLYRARRRQRTGLIGLILEIRAAGHQFPAVRAIELIAPEKTPRNQLGSLPSA